MLSESLAVIGHDGNNRVLVQAPRLEPGDELSNRGIGIGDFSIVGFGKTRFVRFGRIVGPVGIVAVHTDEDRYEWKFAESCERSIHDFFGMPFNAVIAILYMTAMMVSGYG